MIPAKTAVEMMNTATSKMKAKLVRKEGDEVGVEGRECRGDEDGR